jgi:Kdo2-lipid IVA lauroyltransferase/acyltransferase
VNAVVAAPRSALWLRALSRLPFPVLYALTGALVWLLRYVLRYRVRLARSNLLRCFPACSKAEIDAMIRVYYRHLGEVAAEFLKMPAIPAEEMRIRTRFTNAELLAAETDAGRSVLLLGAHLANWEWSLQGTTLALRVPIDAAYKPLHSAGADQELLTLRGRYGARMVAAKRLLRVVAKRRQEVHAIALMADQMPASSGGRQWLTFLGCDTAFYPGPGEIGRLTGYAAFFVGMRRIERGQYELTLHPIAAAGERLDPEVFTLRYAQLLEAQIRLQPSYWMWTHRRWKLARPDADPAPEPNAAG